MTTPALPAPAGAMKLGAVKAETAMGLAGFLLALEAAGLTAAVPAGKATAVPVPAPAAARRGDSTKDQTRQGGEMPAEPGATEAMVAPDVAFAVIAPAGAVAPVREPVLGAPNAETNPGAADKSVCATSEVHISPQPIEAPAGNRPAAGMPAPAPTAEAPPGDDLAFAARLSAADQTPARVEKSREPASTMPPAAAPVEKQATPRPAETVASKTAVREIGDGKAAEVTRPAPVRELSVRLAGERENIEVRMVEQNGEMRVSVRTPDVDMARGLRSGISDLVGRLEHSGYQTEIWRPDQGDLRGGGQHGQPDRGSGGSEREPQQQQQREQREQPSWVEEMSTTIGRKKER